MNREIHVRFWEGLGVRFPRATHFSCATKPAAGVMGLLEFIAPEWATLQPGHGQTARAACTTWVTAGSESFSSGDSMRRFTTAKTSPSLAVGGKQKKAVLSTWAEVSFR